MKTFDIALKYLKDIDLSLVDTYNDIELPSDKTIGEKIEEIHKAFKSDKENNCSNDYYRNMTFGCCLCHLTDLAHKRTSFFYVACEIVESEKAILETDFEKYKRTVYPKVMVDKFINYCNNMNPQPSFLSDTSEVRLDFFATAYHYIIDEIS